MLTDLIKKARKKFHEKLRTGFGNGGFAIGSLKQNSAEIDFNEAEEWLAQTIKESIATAFRETDVEKKTNRTMKGFTGEVSTTRIEGYNSALAEIKQKQQEYLNQK